MAEPLRTPAGILPDGFPDVLGDVDGVFAREDDDDMVTVIAVRATLDPANLECAHEDRTLELAAAFSMAKAEFRLVFGALIQQLGPPTPGRNQPCHCGSGRKFKHCHGA